MANLRVDVRREIVFFYKWILWVMEGRNKKIRNHARKEYNETVRNLALFVRKRDPRYLEFQENNKRAQEENDKETKERQS